MSRFFTEFNTSESRILENKNNKRSIETTKTEPDFDVDELPGCN